MLATATFVSADPALFNPQSGRLDASRIASEIQLPVSTIAGGHREKSSERSQASRCKQPAAGTPTCLPDLGGHRGTLRREQEERPHLPQCTEQAT